MQIKLKDKKVVESDLNEVFLIKNKKNSIVISDKKVIQGFKELI